MSEEEDETVDPINRVNGRFAPGQSGNPAGKPKGAISIYSKQSVKKLQELGQDPIVELSRMYDLAIEKKNTELAFKIMNRLIDFGYQRQPQLVETKHEGAIPILSMTTKVEEPTND